MTCQVVDVAGQAAASPVVTARQPLSHSTVSLTATVSNASTALRHTSHTTSIFYHVQPTHAFNFRFFLGIFL